MESVRSRGQELIVERLSVVGKDSENAGGEGQMHKTT